MKSYKRFLRIEKYINQSFSTSGGNPMSSLIVLVIYVSALTILLYRYIR